MVTTSTWATPRRCAARRPPARRSVSLPPAARAGSAARTSSRRRPRPRPSRRSALRQQEQHQRRRRQSRAGLLRQASPWAWPPLHVAWAAAGRPFCNRHARRNTPCCCGAGHCSSLTGAHGYTYNLHQPGLGSTPHGATPSTCVHAAYLASYTRHAVQQYIKFLCVDGCVVYRGVWSGPGWSSQSSVKGPATQLHQLQSTAR